MRQRWFIALALIAGTAAMGIALAWWTDSLSVAGTVNTGTKDMAFTHYSLTTDRHITGSVSLADEKTLRVTVSNLYPSGLAAATRGRAYLHVQMTNVGSVPVKFDSAALEFDPGSSALLPFLRSYCWLVYDEDGPGPKPQSSYGYLQHPWGNFEALDDALNASPVLKSLVLEPGGWISFDTEDENSIVIRLDQNAPNELENQTLNFNLRLNFKQWNAP